MLFGQEYLPLFQLCLLPILVMVLWRIRLAGHRVPRAVLLGGAALSLIAFTVGSSTRSLGPKRIVITRFSDDPIGAQSRIFRERVESRLESFSTQRVVRSPRAFSDFRSIRKRFGDTRQYDAVIWGKLDGFQIHFPYRPDLEQSRNRTDRMMGLQLATQPPSIMLSRSGDSGSVEFVANVLGAVGGELFDADTEARRDILLKSALKIESRWRSRAHRGLPAWMLANGELERAVSGAILQEGELECALNNYAFAAAQFKPDDNPELAASIYNNWGVALSLRGWLTGDRQALDDARRQFQRAMTTRTMPNPSGYPLRTWQTARINLMLILGKRRDKMLALPGRQIQKRTASAEE